MPPMVAADPVSVVLWGAGGGQGGLGSVRDNLAFLVNGGPLSESFGEMLAHADYPVMDVLRAVVAVEDDPVLHKVAWLALCALVPPVSAAIVAKTPPNRSRARVDVMGALKSYIVKWVQLNTQPPSIAAAMRMACKDMTSAMLTDSIPTEPAKGRFSLEVHRDPAVAGKDAPPSAWDG